MKVIRPYEEELVKVTCLCGCEDYIQFNRFITTNPKEDEELYLITFNDQAENWSLNFKIKILLDNIIHIKEYIHGKYEYHHSNMMNKEQTQKLYDTLSQDLVNFPPEISDYIFQGIEDFKPINKKVDEDTLLIGNLAAGTMWIGSEGSFKDEKFTPFSINMGWRFKDIGIKDILRGALHFLKTGDKYYISRFDCLLNKDDMIVILGSIKYMLENIF